MTGTVHQFSTTNTALERLVLTVPRLDQQMSPQQRQRLATIHMLTQVAFIKLHRPNARNSNTSRQRCIQAARIIADMAAQCPISNPLQLVDPITGVNLLQFVDRVASLMAFYSLSAILLMI
jgi:hypothetical protein